MKIEIAAIRKASYSPVFDDERDFLDVNVPLGTIIDKTIVHPHRKHFFYVNQCQSIGTQIYPAEKIAK